MQPLTNCRILYTRSAKHYPAFAQKIQALGGTALHLPLIDTRAITLNDTDSHYCRHADYLIFTSAAAVQHFPEALWQNQANIAIGPATESAIIQRLKPLFLTAPAPFNSESLLSIFQPQHKHIAIIAAAGGRQLLLNTLTQHNHTQTIYAYERYNPSNNWPETLALPHAILLSSQSALNHLIEISAQSTLNLLQSHTTVIALSPRIGQAAQSAGFQHVFAAPQADENAQIQQLCQWWHKFKEYLT